MPVSARKSQLLQQLGNTAKSGGKVDVSSYHKTAQAVVQPPTPTQPQPDPVAPIPQAPQTVASPVIASDSIPVVTAAPPVVDEPVVEAATQEEQLPLEQSLTQQPQLAQQQSLQLSDEDQKLADFEAAIAEAVPATILANTPDPLNPAQPTSAIKKELAPEAIQMQQPLPSESMPEVSAQAVEPQPAELRQPVETATEPEQPVALEQAATPEQGVAGLQVVEHEPRAEMSPEVSEYLQEVENHQELQPHEVIVANQVPQVLPPKMLPKPVIVLPITPEIEDMGRKKGVVWSIRWLVEWSQKVMKMFSGKVIYKEAKAEA